MRVGIDIHCVGYRQTGNETYTLNLARHLPAAAGVEYRFYHTTPEPPPGLPGLCRRVRPHNPFVRIPFSFPWVLARDRIDIAHFQYVLPPLLPCRAVLSIHDISFEFHPEFFRRATLLRMKTLVAFAVRQAHHVITISEFSRQAILSRYRLPEEKVSAIHNGVSPAFRRLPDTGAVAAVLARHGIRAPYLLAVGNLEPRKNISRLVQAFHLLATQNRLGHTLVLAGQDAFAADAIHRQVEALGLAGRVRATGYLPEEDLVALYNGADLFVYPSLYEGFGIPPLEAMACGVPVVAARSSSLPEVCGDAALYVDPLSSGEMAEGIRHVLENSAERAGLIDRGFTRASRFSWQETAAKTAAVYREMA